MFEEIIALKIQDPKTGLISNTFVKNAEEYSEIMSNPYICSCGNILYKLRLLICFCKLVNLEESCSNGTWLVNI